MSWSVEHVTSAFGVPADLLLNSRYAAKTQAESELLNGTVRSLAKATSDVLTAAYQDLFDDHDAVVQLCTQPIGATPELLALYEAKVMPKEMAVERALLALGASRPQIHAALERVRAEAAELGSR